MWLLHTSTLKPHYFVSPEEVDSGYVILSHVWEPHEQSFHDLQRIHEQCEVSGEDARELVSPKIRQFCELAEQQGYQWAWADTCCIDKTSSAELSEAVNSMFRYYSLALVCFVFLADVPTANAFTESTAASAMSTTSFGESKWHTRGWTLQELIAPRVVLFLSKTWDFLGSKADLAHTLQKITGVPATILRLEQSPMDVNIAQRMSWAAKRKTTRPEDEAYCLLGIFDINMPTLYGEGRKAFQRLQKKIMKQSSDTTLFAWGGCCPSGLSKLDKYSTGPGAGTGLFATSPSDFRSSSNVTSSLGSSGKRNMIPGEMNNAPTTFAVTPYGVLSRIPIVTIKGRSYGDLSWRDGLSRLLLILNRRPSSSHLTLPQYDIGARYGYGPCGGSFRMVALPDEDRKGGRIRSRSRSPEFEASWSEVYLPHYVDPSAGKRLRLYIPINHIISAPIRIPESLISNVAEDFIDYVHVSVTNEQLPWYGDPPTMIVLSSSVSEHIALQFGRCAANASSVGGGEMGLGAIWANMIRPEISSDCLSMMDLVDAPKKHEWHVNHNVTWLPQEHACPADHVLTWPGLEKSFALDFDQLPFTFTLVFTPSLLTDTLTLASFHVEQAASSRPLSPRSPPRVDCPLRTEPPRTCRPLVDCSHTSGSPTDLKDVGLVDPMERTTQHTSSPTSRGYLGLCRFWKSQREKAATSRDIGATPTTFTLKAQLDRYKFTSTPSRRGYLPKS